MVVSSGDEGRHWTTCLHRRWKLMKIVSPGLPGRVCQLNIWKTRNPSQCTVLIRISNPGKKKKTCFSEWMIHVFAVCFAVNCMLLQCCCDMCSLAAARDQVSWTSFSKKEIELIMLMTSPSTPVMIEFTYEVASVVGCLFCIWTPSIHNYSPCPSQSPQSTLEGHHFFNTLQGLG